MRPDPELVTEIIRETAATEILPRFQRLAAHDISEKSPGDLVTIADTESEKVLSRRLSDLLPGSVAIGEEGVAANPETMRLISEDNPVWIIDPVDGTHNFAHGKACFAVIVCLVQKGQTVAGWIHDPIANSTLYAEHGAGAWDSSQRLSLQPAKPIAQMTGSLKRSQRHQIADRQSGGETGLPSIIKRYRCVGREYMDLARGKLDFAAYSGTLKPWDHAAGILIYRESGGFDGMAGTGASYRVTPNIFRGEVIMTPSKDIWTTLTSMIG